MTTISVHYILSMPMSVEEDLTKELLAAHGEFLQGKPLRKSLGYRSQRSLYRAIAGETSPPPVPVFKIEGRRGWIAKTRDVAVWLANVQDNCSKPVEEKST